MLPEDNRADRVSELFRIWTVAYIQCSEHAEIRRRNGYAPLRRTVVNSLLVTSIMAMSGGNVLARPIHRLVRLTPAPHLRQARVNDNNRARGARERSPVPSGAAACQPAVGLPPKEMM